jgi:hypothetical protein
MADLNKSLTALKSTIEPKKIRLPGSLGIPMDGALTVNVPNRPGYVYVRILGNTSELIQAYNDQVSPVYDLPVTVTRDETKYVVEGRDIARYTNWGSSPYLPAHGVQHSLNGTGGDIVWVYSEQFMPLCPMPSGTSGTLIIYPYTYNWRGVWKTAGGTGTSSIAPYLPVDDTKQKVLLLYIDGDTSNPTWLDGTEAPVALSAKSDLIPHLPPFTMEVGIPLAMVRVPSGTTSIGWSNVYDIRQYFGGRGTGTSGGTGSSGIGEAPIDGTPYSRQDAGWVSSPTGSSGIGEAPIDGTVYGRKDSVWIRISGSSGSESPGFQILTDEANITWDISYGSGRVTLGDNRILDNPTNMAAGEHYFLSVIQSPSGSNTLAYGNAYKFPGNNYPALSQQPDFEDILSFECDGTYMLNTGIVRNLTNVTIGPDSIADLEQWLKADAIVGLVDSDPVATWPDSANSNDAVQASGTYQPLYKTNRINGLPALYFADNTFWMTEGYNPTLPFTLVMVYKRSATTGNRMLDGSNNWLVGPYAGVHSSYTAEFISGDAVGLNDVVYTVLTESSGGVEMFQNGVSQGTTANNEVPGTLYMGGGGDHAAEAAAGDIAEIIIYSRVLDSSEMTVLNNYINSKYGLT